MTDLSSLDPVLTSIAAMMGAAVYLFAVTRGSALMMFFQQEEYDNARFVDWFREKRAFDTTASFGLLIAVLWSGVMQSDLSANMRESVPWLVFGPFVVFAISLAAGAAKSVAAQKTTKSLLSVRIE